MNALYSRKSVVTWGRLTLFVVNINAIGKLINYWDRKLRVVLSDFPDEEFLVSRDKSKQLREWIDR